MIITVVIIAIIVRGYLMFQKWISSNSVEINDKDDVFLDDAHLDTSITYSPKRVLTVSELAFYEKLKIAINDKYYIYPQQAYRTFIKRTVGKDVGYNKKRYASELSYIADFLIVDKITNLPVATVEKNDNSHYTRETAERDKVKARLCHEAGISYISFWDYANDRQTPYANDINYIKKRFQEKGNINLYEGDFI